MIKWYREFTKVSKHKNTEGYDWAFMSIIAHISLSQNRSNIDFLDEFHA